MTRYCGRDFSCKDLQRIRKLIAVHPDSSKTRLSQQVCELLDWKKPDGGLKEMSCRAAMLRMHRDQLIVLRPPRRQPIRAVIRFTDSTAPQTPIRALLHEVSTPQLRRVSTPADSRLWKRIHRTLSLSWIQTPARRSAALFRCHRPSDCRRLWFRRNSMENRTPG